MPMPEYTGQATPNYSGQAYVPSGGGGMSAEEKLMSMKDLLPPNLLGLLARIIQGGGGAQPQGQPQQAPQQAPQGQWNNLYPMPQPGIPNVNGAMPMRPSEPASFPMMYPNGIVRG